MVSAAKRDGRYDAGVADISAGARLLEPEALIWRDPITGARAHAATVEVDRGVSFADALSKLRSWRAAAAAAKRNTDGGDAAADSREGGGAEEGGGVEAGEEEACVEEAGEEAAPAAARSGDVEDGEEEEGEGEGEEEGGGIFRSRRPQYGEHLLLLALPKAREPHMAVLTRPNTGLSLYEEAWTDLHRKCARVLPPSAAEADWTAAYNGACNERIGGRLTRIQLITGSTLPMLPVLEEVAKKHSANLTARDRAVGAVRVILDGRRLLGVRFARSCMADLKEELLKWNLARGATHRKVETEPAAPVDPKALARALRPPATITSFFAARPASQAAAPAGTGTGGKQPAGGRGGAGAGGKKRSVLDMMKGSSSSSSAAASSALAAVPKATKAPKASGGLDVRSFFTSKSADSGPRSPATRPSSEEPIDLTSPGGD